MKRRPVFHALSVLAAASIVSGLLGAGAAAAAPARPGAASVNAAVPGAGASPTMTATTQLSGRRFVAAGTRAYVVGAEDGTFPPIGWHITGQMGGVWAPPVKLLDGLWFQVQGSWLDSASSYTSGPGFAQMSFPVTDGLRPTLTEFAPDGSPVVLFGLTLVPASGSATTAHVVSDAHSQVDAAYPWTGTNPTFASYNHPDAASASGGVLQFQQQQTPWYAEVGASPHPASISTGTGDWGPTPAGQQSAFGTNGKGGELSWDLPVPAGGRTLWLGVAGSQTGSGPALSALNSGLANPQQLLSSKIAERDSVAGQTQVQVPDSSVQQAVLWSKLNLADLRRTITGAQIRDTKAGTVYPAPLATVPTLSGIDAAYPDYAEFFGTDGAYSTYGLSVTGQWQTAMDQLNSMRTVSQIVNGDSGKVVHEVTSTGAVYYGDNSEPGDINETTQFAIAAGLVWRWSGDSTFLRQNYQFIKAGEQYLASLATGPGHLWPVGDGIVENPALGGEQLDVASESVQALGTLHDMAAAMGDSVTASWAAGREQAMLAAFPQWWIASQNLYADSMCVGTEGNCTQAGEQLQQRWHISDSPMEQDAAPVSNADSALKTMEGPTFTGSCGLYVDGVGGPMGTGGQTCYLLGTGAMGVAEANYGRTGQSISYLDKVASQLTVEMPGSLPELAASAQYNPFEAFTSRANVMQAWSSYGPLWASVHDLLGVSPDVPGGSVAVVPEVPASWPRISVSNLRIGDSGLTESASHNGNTYQTQVSGAGNLALTIGTVLPAGSAPRSVTLNGEQVSYQQSSSNRGLEILVSVPHPAATETLAVKSAG